MISCFLSFLSMTESIHVSCVCILFSGREVPLVYDQFPFDGQGIWKHWPKIHHVYLVFDPAVPFLEFDPADILTAVKNSVCASI